MDTIYDAKLLIVDDNAELLALLCEQLRGAGYGHIRTAQSCAAARTCFAAEQPELMILDINLPDGDGFSLFRALRAKADVPALFLSARQTGCAVSQSRLTVQFFQCIHLRFSDVLPVLPLHTVRCWPGCFCAPAAGDMYHGLPPFYHESDFSVSSRSRVSSVLPPPYNTVSVQLRPMNSNISRHFREAPAAIDILSES